MTRRRALALFAAALVAAAGSGWIIATSDHEEDTVATAILSVPVGLAFVTAGLVAAVRRPENRIGSLMTLVGFTWFLGALARSDVEILFAVGLLLGNLAFAFFAQLVLSYPTGRLKAGAGRMIVAAAFVLVTAGQLVVYLVRDPRAADCPNCPDNLLLVRDESNVADAVELVWRLVGLALVVATAVVLRRRWRAASPARRRVLAPVYATSGVTLVAIAAFLVAQEAGGDMAQRVTWWLLLVALLAVPLAFLYGLLRVRLARADVPRLLLQTPDEPTPREAEIAIGEALGDPTLQLVFWLSEQDGYVDTGGKRVELPARGSGRAVTPIAYGERPIAALIHDPSLLEEQELVEAVVATARLAIAKDRSIQEVRAAEARNRAFLDAIPDLMFQIAADGTYLGYKAESDEHLLHKEVVGLKVSDRMPEPVAGMVMDAIDRALGEQRLQTLEYELEFRDAVRSYEARITASGPDEVLMIVREITERIRQQEELRMERDLVRTVVDTAPALLCAVDADGRVERINRALARLSGISEEEARGKKFWELFAAQGKAADLEKRFREHVVTRRIVRHETLWSAAHGGHAVVSWSANWYPGEGGGDRFLVTGADITERKRYEEDLERQRDFLNALANNTPSLLVLVEQDGVVPDRASNAAFERLLRADPANMGGQIFWEAFVAPEDRDEVRERILGVVAGGESDDWENEWLTSDGERVLVAWSCVPLPRLDERQLFLIGGMDITERQRQEEELRRSRARIVQAGDDERRRLERNLHDGAQQRLVSLSLAMRLAQTKLRSDPEAAGALLDTAREELTQALEELRELARGLHPAVLTDRGLEPALVAVAARSPIPVDLDIPSERMPGPVEAAAYYVVSEALTNVAKYAHVTSAAVTVGRANGRLVVEVRDNGIGGADPGSGTGLRGLADRVAALDGKLAVESAPGGGTRIRAEIPLSDEEAVRAP
jgi:PAS domain S-box-containing protein